jgi:hypothetical protein
MTDDTEHLRLLSIFHYIVGGLSALCACFPFIHLAVGIGIVSHAFPAQQNSSPPPEIVGWFFIVLATTFIIIGWAYAICTVVAGRCLQRRRAYLFCMTMAGLSCANMPFGICLGVFTLIVLLRPSVKLLFEKEKAAASGLDFD